MQFNRVSGPVQDLHIWSATSNGYSFVISFEFAAVPASVDAMVTWHLGARSTKADAP